MISIEQNLIVNQMQKLIKFSKIIILIW